MGLQPQATNRVGIVSATLRPCLRVLTGPDRRQPLKAGADAPPLRGFGLDRLSPARQRLLMQVRMIGSAEALQCRRRRRSGRGMGRLERYGILPYIIELKEAPNAQAPS
jgi:hypothetical protein